MEPVKPIKLERNLTVKDLVKQMRKAGFGARKIALASEIISKMFSDPECKVFLGLAGAMVPAGMKQIIIDLIKEKKINVLVTTGANLTHDLIEALGENHYHCDTWNDEKLHELGFDRMYNVLMKNKSYPKLEKFFEDNWEKLRQAKTIKEFLRKIGEILAQSSTLLKSQNICERKLSSKRSGGGGCDNVIDGWTGGNKNDSILKACHNNNVDLYCPALADSGIGLMIWGRLAKGKDIKIDAFKDMKEIIDTAWSSKSSGVIYICGGVPKNFIQQSLQFSKGADYGVQITTDHADPGGSSGAPLEEGKSWGKLKTNADFIDVHCDATIALPLIFGSLR